MQVFFFLILLLMGGGAFLYEESPEFQQHVDQFAAELEAESAQSGNPYAAPEFRRAEFESTAFDRRDAFRTRSTEPASVGRAPQFGSRNAGNLADRDRNMRSAHYQATRTLEQHHSRDERVTRDMTGYYDSRHKWDASRNAQRRSYR